MGKIMLANTEIKKFYLANNEVKKIYLGGNEIWSASNLPNWIDPSIEQTLAALTPATDKWVDMAWTPSSPIQGFTQFYYRVFCTVDAPMGINNPNALRMFLQSTPSGFSGFTYYSWGFKPGIGWNLRYSYANQSACAFYDAISSSNHRAFIKGTITSTISNSTGYPFEDYR